MKPTEEIRTELLAALSRLGQLRPEWRLGQTLANLAMTAGRLDSGGVWDLEDEEALAAARTLIGQYSDIGSGEVEARDAPERRLACLFEVESSRVAPRDPCR